MGKTNGSDGHKTGNRTLTVPAVTVDGEGM